MKFSINDLIGFVGVAMLLVAFFLNLKGILNKDSVVYILLNLAGAALACIASYLIRYYPFVLLEATWTLVSAYALFRYLRNRRSINPQ